MARPLRSEKGEGRTREARRGSVGVEHGEEVGRVVARLGQAERAAECELADDVHRDELEQVAHVDRRLAAGRADLLVELDAQVVEARVDELFELDEEVHRERRADASTSESMLVVRERREERGLGDFLRERAARVNCLRADDDVDDDGRTKNW